VASDARLLRRVLVVDDDPGILRYIEMLLQDEGFVVQTAADGVDAVALATAHPPDLIVLDISMPRMDGREVARTLREHGLRLPVILMSAGHDAGREARRLGAAGSLGKPFSADQMLDTVNGVLTSYA
jgi:two-component system, OmpR family, KDP operon response regulator KdpE